MGKDSSRVSRARRSSGVSTTVPAVLEVEVKPPAVDVTQELLNLIVECADVSHPTRPLEIHKRWAVFITREFLQQGELEEARGVPISPLCAKTAILDNPSFARAQQGFLDFVVSPKLRVISKLCGQDMVWLRFLAANRNFWSAHDSPGFAMITAQLEEDPVFSAALPSVRLDVPATCACGNVFMNDSLFCRRCGAKRADVMDQRPTDRATSQTLTVGSCTS